MALRALLLLGFLVSTHAWGGLFNRFSSDMLANMGYGHSNGVGGYKEYPYNHAEEDPYSEVENSGNTLDEIIEEAAQCYSSSCISTNECCHGFVCLNTEDGGRCLPAVYGRKIGEICNRENQCDAGLICEEVVPGEMHVCRPPSPGRKQYNEDCAISSECDISRGLCCIIQRRHRQKPRKSCGYFKDPAVCIGPVASDQVRQFVQHTAGEKRVGVFHLH